MDDLGEDFDQGTFIIVEGFVVIVGVDEPGRDLPLAGGAHLALLGVEHIDAQHLHHDAAAGVLFPLRIRLAENDEEIAKNLDQYRKPLSSDEVFRQRN